MKLKTVPKIRTDCISCNGYSSVRIREGGNKTAVGRPPDGEAYSRSQRPKGVLSPSTKLRINSVEGAVGRTTSGMGILRQSFGIPWPTCPDEDSGLPRSGVVEVWVPQREVFGDNAGIRISPCSTLKHFGDGRRWSSAKWGSLGT